MIPTRQAVVLWCHLGSVQVKGPDRSVEAQAGDLIIAPLGATVRGWGVVLPMRFKDTELRGYTRVVHLGQSWDARWIHEFGRNLLGQQSIAQDLMWVTGQHDITPPLPESTQALAIAKIYLDNPAEQRSLEELAQSQYVCARTVQRQFSAETGLAFCEWRAKLRVQAAAERIASGMTLHRAAVHAGFGATSTLTRACKRHTGMAPAAFVNAWPQVAGNEVPSSSMMATPQQDIMLWMYQGSATVTTEGFCRFVTTGDTVTLPAGTNTRIDVAAGSIALPVPIAIDETRLNIRAVVNANLALLAQRNQPVVTAVVAPEKVLEPALMH